MRRPQSLLVLAAFLLLSPVAALAAEKAPEGAALVAEGDQLYRSGAYAEALKKFEAVMAAGKTTPAILYKAATCYGQALGDKEKELELKRRAVPLLEKELAGGDGSVEAHYYLAAIYLNDLNDPAKGIDAARRGVALAERSKGAPAGPVETEFRVGRLHSFLGNEKAAAAHYQRFLDAAERGPGPADRAALKHAISSLGAHGMRSGDHAAAAKAYERLLEMDPLADQVRHQLGIAHLRAGDHERAAQVWAEATTDEYRTEFMYLNRIVTRYVRAGKPPSSKLAPDAASLDNQALVGKITEAAVKYREIRVAEEEARKTAEAEERARRKAEREAKTSLTPEEVKARVQEKLKERQAIKAKDPDAFKEEETSIWTVLDNRKTQKVAPPEPPPQSAENAEAERDFLFLMVEYVKRGPLIRNFSFENGFVELIFR